MPKNGFAMKLQLTEKLKSRAGVTRAAAILIVVIVICAVAALIPVIRVYTDGIDAVNCMNGLDTANNFLSIEYLNRTQAFTAEEAKEYVTGVMDGWDDMCPSHGNIYLSNDDGEEQPFTVICGIHDKDLKQRCRYNASYAIELVKEAVAGAAGNGDKYPASVKIRTNNETLTAYLTDEKLPFRSGTDNTVGYSGTVIYYSVAGHSDFGSGSSAKDGEIWYFV